MILDYVKTALRTSTENAAIIAQLEMLINAAIADLNAAGIKTEQDAAGEYPPQITTAITLFVNAQFSADINLAAAYDRAYQSMKTHLAILGGVE